MINYFSGISNWTNETFIFVAFLYYSGYAYIVQRGRLMDLIRENMKGYNLTSKGNLITFMLLTFNVLLALLLYILFIYYPKEGLVLFLANTIFHAYRMNKNQPNEFVEEMIEYANFHLPLSLTLLFRLI